MLPSRERTPQTKTWVVPVRREDLTDYVGYLSGATLRRVLEAVSEELGGP